MAELRPFHLQKWLDSHPDWSRHTTAAPRTLFSVRFNRPWDGYIAASPVAYLEKPRAGKREFVITAELYRTLVKAVSDEAFRDLLEVSWEAGCRPQESLRVEARHVDLRIAMGVHAKQGEDQDKVANLYPTETVLAITQRRMLKHPEGPIFRNRKGNAPGLPTRLAAASSG